MRFLGIDYGRRRIGLALSDEEGVLASPLPPHVRTRSEADVLNDLASLMKRHGVGTVIVGWPLNMDGSRGKMAREAEAFAHRLQKRTSTPAELFDERLTTREAERALLEADLSRRKRKLLRDSLSAVLILQGYLDRRDASDLE